MTEQTQPTDAELLAAWDSYVGAPTAKLPLTNSDKLAFARAVLAKWGTPAGAGEVVAWVDERAISWLENSRAHSATITTTLGKAKSSERPMPLHGAPQPTQAQAGAVPLTDEWIRSRCKEPWIFETAKQWIRIAESAHGIKGADHG